MADLQGPKIRVGKFDDGKRDAGQRRAPSCSTRRASEPGDIDARRPRLQGAAARREARRHAAAQRRPDRADRRRRCAASRCTPSVKHRRRAVQQQGHQQAGRRPDGAGADRQGHGGHQDRDELPGRLPGGELPEERHRHGDGAPAGQRGRRAASPQAGADRQDRAQRGDPAARGHPEGQRRHHGGARRPGGRGRQRGRAGAAEDA